MFIPPLVYRKSVKFLHDPRNLVAMLDAYLKTVAMDGVVVWMFADIAASFEQMSRALPSYAFRGFDDSMEIAAVAGAFKYGCSPKARLKAQEYNITSIDPGLKDYYMELSKVPFALIGAANHIAYQFPIGNINFFVFSVEVIDVVLQTYVMNSNSEMITHGIQSGNFSEIAEAVISETTLNSELMLEASKIGFISVFSYNGFYLTAKSYLDMIFSSQLSGSLTFDKLFTDIGTVTLTWVAIAAILEIDPFTAELGNDIAYSDFQYFDNLPGQQCEGEFVS